MAVTVLAVLFLAIMVVIAVVGYKTVIRQRSVPQDADLEKCAICRQSFDKEKLILRQIGDYKLLYFCSDCILKLYADLGIKN